LSTVEAPPASNFFVRARLLYQRASHFASRLQWLALLAARLLVARVFLLSGLTKWDGLTIREDTYYLFADEYFSKYALPAPVIASFATAASIAEIVLPLLLAVGLLTRAAALGLLTMTLVIQFFVYSDAWWTVHAWWSALLMLLIAFGPGAASVDHNLKIDRAIRTA
jgi:putative oxidoreductase